MKKNFRTIIASLLLFLIVILCSQLRSNVIRNNTSDDDFRPPLNMAQILEIENNFTKLKVGMPAKKVIPALGMTRYHDVVFGSGPMSDFRSAYNLGRGYSLVIAFDATKKPSILNWAELRGDGRLIQRVGK